MLSTKYCPWNHATLAYGNGETVLLIERNKALLALGKNVLEKLNYHVLTAPGHQELSSRIDLSQQQIDLLILDGSAPIRESREIVQQVRAHRPEAKTLFSSVYDSQLETECGKKIAKERIINKPFRIDDFSRIVHQTLQ